jgi:hypothetical protein
MVKIAKRTASSLAGTGDRCVITIDRWLDADVHDRRRAQRRTHGFSVSGL